MCREDSDMFLPIVGPLCLYHEGNESLEEETEEGEGHLLLMIRVIMTAVMAMEKVKTRKRGVDHQGLVISWCSR